MTKLLFLGYALALVLITAGSPTDRDGCCLEKTVGGVTYTFLEKGDTGAYRCLSPCVYRKKGEMGPKFCFAKGEKEVQCEDIQSPVDPAAADVKELNMIYQDERICDEQLQSFLSAGLNTTLTIRCCNSSKISTCVGLACLEECGGMTCMIPVTDMANTKDCTEDTYANFLLEAVSCAMLVTDNNCPYGYMDRKCACCKFPGYTTNFNCSFDCRCNGICDWLDQKGIDVTYISWCRGCSDNCFDPTDPVSSATPNPIDSYPSLAYYPPPPPKLNCSKVADDCTLCKQCDYANDCAADCKCNCTCKYITGCTGFNPREGEQWSSCWRDYAFCCECPVPGQNYAIPCSGMCGGNVNNPPSHNMSYPVPKGIVQSTAFDCNGS